MQKPEQPISDPALFNDLVSSVNKAQQKTVNSGSVNEGGSDASFNSFSSWDRMKKQASSTTDMDKLRSLHKILTPIYNSIYGFSSLFIVIYIISFIVTFFYTKELLFSKNIELVNQFFMYMFFAPIISTLALSFLKNCYKRTILLFFKLEFGSFFDDIKKLEINTINGNEIFITNYICANLEIFDPELRKQAVAYILRSTQDFNIKKDDYHTLVYSLPKNFNHITSSPTIQSLLHKSRELEINKLINNDINQ